MEGMGIDLGILLESKVTDGIYTQKLSGYSVAASNAPSAHQGETALFWQPNKLYMVEDWQISGPNVLTFVLVTGSTRFFFWGVLHPTEQPQHVGNSRAGLEQMPLRAYPHPPRGFEHQSPLPPR
jgi:hypothetical protein